MELSTPAVRQMIGLFRHLVAELPPGTATLKVETGLKNAPNGTRLEVTPSVGQAARMVAMVLDRGTIFLTFGRAASFEFQVECGDSIEASPFEEIETLSRAVIEGKIEEELWVVGSQVFKGTARITLPTGTRTMHYRGSFHPVEKTEKQQVKYLPYRVSGK